MALIKPGPGIVDIRGRQGGHVYQRDGSGLHVKAYRHPRHKRTTGQAAQRNAYREACTFCSKDPDAIACMPLWERWADLHPSRNMLGEPKILSAFSACLQHNLALTLLGLSLQPCPPLGPRIDLIPYCKGHWKHNDDAANKIVLDQADAPHNGTAQRNTSIMHDTPKVGTGSLLYTSGTDWAFVGPVGFGFTFSIAFWCNRQGPPTLEPQIITNLAAANSFIAMPVNAKVTLSINGFGILASTTPLLLDQWYFVVLTCDGTNYNLYVNNQLEATAAAAGIFLSNIMFGRPNTIHFRGWDGMLDCIGLFNKVLDQKERDFLWNNGNGTELLKSISYTLVTGNPWPDCTGKYILAGLYNGHDYYRRTDGAWYIWYAEAYDRWYIGYEFNGSFIPLWYHDTSIGGIYEGYKWQYKQATVTPFYNTPPTV